MWRLAGPDPGNDTIEELEKDQRPPPMSAGWQGSFAAADLEEMHEKETVYGTEPAVMDAEKRDKKQLGQRTGSRIRFEESYFQDVEETGNQVFHPVKKHDVPDIPAEEEDAEKGYKVGPDECPKGQVVFLFCVQGHFVALLELKLSTVKMSCHFSSRQGLMQDFPTHSTPV